MKKKQVGLHVFLNLRVMIFAAILAAMSIVLGKYLRIDVSGVIRISFENLPIIMSGIFFGPVVGVLTAVVADIVGCILVGLDINPLITVGAAAIGLTSGLVSHYIVKNPLSLRIAASVAAAHLLGSVLIKTYALSVYYTMPIYELALWRLLTYTIIGTAEFFIIYMLIRNRAISAQLERLVSKK